MIYSQFLISSNITNNSIHKWDQTLCTILTHPYSIVKNPAKYIFKKCLFVTVYFVLGSIISLNDDIHKDFHLNLDILTVHLKNL